MRWDVLAQVMSNSSIFSGAKVLIFDSMVGLLVGSAAYRMRGRGRILAVYGGQQPHLDMVDWLNLNDAETCIIEVSTF